MFSSFVTSCATGPERVNLRKARNEHMFSGIAAGCEGVCRAATDVRKRTSFFDRRLRVSSF